MHDPMIRLSHFDAESFQLGFDFANFEEMKTWVLWNINVNAETETSDVLLEEKTERVRKWIEADKRAKGVKEKPKERSLG